MSTRAAELADRIEQGAATLAAFARDLSEADWRTTVLPDGRTAGVIVHHVASMYPIEMDVVLKAAQGNAIVDVTWELVAQINADHATKNAGVTRTEALDLLAKNSRAAAAGVRRLTDAQLGLAVPFSLSFDAPMTVQFIIEDHPLRHPWHHLARIRRALGWRSSGKVAAA